MKVTAGGSVTSYTIIKSIARSTWTQCIRRNPIILACVIRDVPSGYVCLPSKTLIRGSTSHIAHASIIGGILLRGNFLI